MTLSDLKLYARYVAWCGVLEVVPMPISAWMAHGSRLWHKEEFAEVELARAVSA
jgi:hypothetical protein